MSKPRTIEVYADWPQLGGPQRMGRLTATPVRGKEVFAFDYDATWLASGAHQPLDPSLALYTGPQYPSAGRELFGVFMDSSPDRWGRVLMQRREALLARTEGRSVRRLRTSDYLLGVHDGHRMGALRFMVDNHFLGDNDELASPPWTSLRALERASYALEQEDAERKPDYNQWLRMLIAPGGSLGGARPKASVRDQQGRLWIAKFPSRHDQEDIGAWEAVVHHLAQQAGIAVPSAQIRQFGSARGVHRNHHTYLSLRFDRTPNGGRHHVASAMTLLDRMDGANAQDGASYLELADVLIQHGANPASDLEQLWRRIVFSIAVSNTDDHLRNHGFMLRPCGWSLAPAYDLNPNPHGAGLTLNISETDNALDVDLALEVASAFRVNPSRASHIATEVCAAVAGWRSVAHRYGLSQTAQDRMAPAFQVAEAWAARHAAPSR